MKVGTQIIIALFSISTILGCCSVLALYISLPKIRLAFGKTVIHVTVLYLIQTCVFLLSLRLALFGDFDNLFCIFADYIYLYTILCHVFWVNNLIIKIHLSVRQLVTPGRARRLSETFYIVYGYGIPALIVISTEFLSGSIYGFRRSCMLDVRIRILFYSTFLLLIGVVNSVLCGITDCTIRRCKERQNLKKIQRMSYLGLSAFLLGLLSEFIAVGSEGLVDIGTNSNLAIYCMTLLPGFIFSMQLIFLCHWAEIRSEFKEGWFCWIKVGDERNSAALTDLVESPNAENLPATNPEGNDNT